MADALVCRFCLFGELALATKLGVIIYYDPNLIFIDHYCLLIALIAQNVGY
jgi:hypothetical protein